MADDDIVNRLRLLSNGLTPISESNVMREAATEIERLRAERDEARREVCNLSIHPPRDYALERKWDCFEETIR